MCMSGGVRVLLRTVVATLSTLSFLVCEASPTAHAASGPPLAAREAAQGAASQEGAREAAQEGSGPLPAALGGPDAGSAGLAGAAGLALTAAGLLAAAGAVGAGSLRAMRRARG